MVVNAAEIFPTPIPTGSSKTPLIVGLTIGGIILAVLGVWFYIRYSRKK